MSCKFAVDYSGTKIFADDGKSINTKKLPTSAEATRKVLKATEDLLSNSKVVKPSVNLKTIVGVESLINSSGVDAALHSAEVALESFSHAVGKDNASIKSAYRVASGYLAKSLSANTSREAWNNHYLRVGTESAERDNAIKTTLSAVYAPSLHNTLSFVNPTLTPAAAMEAFGADVNDLVSDIKTGLAVNVLQDKASLINKLLHRKTVTDPYIQYDVEYGQIYDMLLSNDASAEVRNQGDHQKPVIALEVDPSDVANELHPIIVKKTNDTAGVVYEDGYLVPGLSANMMQLALDPNEFGNTHLNYTDLVSEGVTLSSIIVELKTNSSVTYAADKTEKIKIDLKGRSAIRFMMAPNTADSGMRQTNGEYEFRLTSDTKKIDGSKSEILAKCTNEDLIKLTCMIASVISLKTSDVNTAVSNKVSAYAYGHDVVASEVDLLAKNLTAKIVGIEISAYYNEENVRKSNLAVRTHKRSFTFEIQNGRNILIDYPLRSELDTEVADTTVQLASNIAAIGVDHTAIHVIVDQLKWIYARNVQERANPNFYNVWDRINNTCPAGMQVYPTAMIGTLDVSDINGIRDADVTGDIRQAVEYSLICQFAQFYQNSLYRNRLGGEAPRFRVLTSPLVLSTIFNIPHIHDHLNRDADNGNSEFCYRRVLPDGTELEFVTTTFAYMRDKIIMIPYRDSEDDVTNFGINADYGTFVAQYNPQYENGVNKRLLLNTRSMPIPTNPSGFYLTVVGLDTLANLNDDIAVVDDRLPDANELLNSINNQ